MLKYLKRENNLSQQIPKVQCNCFYHQTCKLDGQKCTCPFFYLYKVSKQHIKDWDIYPFFCAQCVNNLKKQKKRFEEVVVTALFQEYMNYKTYSQQYNLPYLALQLGQPIFQNVRLTKCVKKILRTIKNQQNIYVDEILSDFAFYCKKRKILRKLAQKNGIFHSQIIQEKSLDLQQLMKKSLFNPKQDAICKIPLIIEEDELQYYFCYKDKYVITAYQSLQNLYIDFFDLLSGKLKNKIYIEYENYACISNVQIQISENLQYLIAIINNTTLIIYDLKKRSYQTKQIGYQLDFCNMFLGNDKLFIMTETYFSGYKLPKVEPFTEFSFPFFKDDYFNIGGQYYQNKNEFAFLSLDGLYFINIQTLEFGQVKKFKFIKGEYPYFDNQFQIMNTNNLLIFLRFNEQYAQLVIRSLLKSKIIRKFTFKIKYPTDFKLQIENVQIYLLQKSTKLAIIQQDQVTVLNLMTGRKDLRLKFQNVQNQFDNIKSIQISDARFFLIAETNQIIVNKLEQ